MMHHALNSSFEEKNQLVSFKLHFYFSSILFTIEINAEIGEKIKQDDITKDLAAEKSSKDLALSRGKWKKFAAMRAMVKKQ
jgi:hypothetical protein